MDLFSVKDPFVADGCTTYWHLKFNDDLSSYDIVCFTPPEGTQLSADSFFKHKEDITDAVIKRETERIKGLVDALKLVTFSMGNKLKKVEESAINVLDKLERDVILYSDNHEGPKGNQ